MRSCLVDKGNDSLIEAREGAKKATVELIKTLGFAPVDLGTLASASKLIETKGVFSGTNLLKL